MTMISAPVHDYVKPGVFNSINIILILYSSIRQHDVMLVSCLTYANQKAMLLAFSPIAYLKAYTTPNALMFIVL